MKAKEALELAIELVSDRLDLIRQRELDERDGVEEGRLKEALSCLEEIHEAPKGAEEISEATIVAWRQELAEHEAENMSHGELIDILIDGCEGYSNMDASEISKLHKRFITY